MSKNHVRGVSMLVAAAVAAALSQVTVAQEAPADEDKLGEVVVYATRYRDRTADTAPVLRYDLEYFQKFEPDTVGDMLKRVPGAAFVGTDIMEFDEVQLRGLGAGYTQVLVNGRKVPGAGDDRTFFVDRIPAEMVDHIEIKRSASANRSGDAVAGALNIVLKDSYAFDGTYIRAGANRYYDGEVNPTVSLVTSGGFAGGRILFGAGVQDRYRAKIKRSDRWSDDSQEEFESFEDQTEVKDGRDYSANLSYIADVGTTGRFSLDGFYTRTRRDMTEVSFETEYDDEDVITSDVPGSGRWDQTNWGIGAEYRFDMAGGTTEFSLDHSRFDNLEAGAEQASGYENDELVEFSDETETAESNDKETGFKLAHKRDIGGGAQLEIGVDYRRKNRDFALVNREVAVEYDDGEIDSEEDAGTATYSDVTEKRLDPYFQISGKSGIFAWEAGLRYETTRSTTTYRTEEYEEGELDDEDGPFTASRKYNELLPSVSFRWDVTGSDRISLSLARTVRRPNFRDITPVTFEEEFEDNDLRGNPDLKPETANGIDLGLEHRLGSKGVFGVNFFYRDVKNLIELVNTGDFSDEYEGLLEDLEDALESGDEDDIADAQEELDDTNPTWVYQQRNVGKGKVWGVEIDLSTPLTVFGLDNTGVFLNYSYLDSKATDFIGKRRFNNQARSTFNVGFIQDIPSWSASFGANYRKQGNAFSRVQTEEVTIKYGGELELFLEKRLGKRFSARLTASNLLDASKKEYFNVFDDEAGQVDRDFSQFEIEREEAGPRYQLVFRWAF